MSALQDAVADLDEARALMEIRRMIGRGKEPEKVLVEARRGLHIVGERFEAKQYALIELEMANELFRECVKMVETLTDKRYLGRTVETDERIRRLSKTDMGRVD